MCTAFVRKGRDIITGFNFDMNTGGIDYRPFVENDRVFLGLTFPKEVVDSLPPTLGLKNGVRLVQGVSAGGWVAGQLCNMDLGKPFTASSADILTIDQLTDRFVTEHYPFAQLKTALETREVTNIPGGVGNTAFSEPPALHSLFVDPQGNIVFVEPGNGYAVIREDYFTVTNFSILEVPLDLDEAKFGYYGVDRYRRSLSRLKRSTEAFSVADGLELLCDVKQTGEWATRFSFVYSRNEDTVYYCTDGDFDHVTAHRFGSCEG